MTIKLKSIPIGSASWPQLPPQTQPKKTLHSAARGDGYVQSDALRTFGAPRPRVSSPAKPAVKSRTWTKSPFLKMGLAVCAILLVGLAFAKTPSLNGQRSATNQINLKEPAMYETYESNWPSTTSLATAGAPLILRDGPGPGSAMASLHAADIAPAAEMKPIEAVHHLNADSAAEPEMAGTSTVAAVAVGTTTAVALGVGLAVTRRRRSPSLPDKTTPEIEYTPPDSSADGELVPKSDILTTPAVSGLAYVEPAALLGSMKRAFPKQRIAGASGTFALTSVTGHNEENQDYGIAFDFSSPVLGPVQVVFMADGCGGHFGGRDAAYTAVSACADHLLKSTERNLIDVASNCLEAARQHVASVGTQMWGVNDFRCTLIVLLANENEYALAHIGDGGMDVRRANGSWERLLTPQRQEGTGYLTGSLGPRSYGQAAIKTLPRVPGDWLVAGTDGVYADEVTDLEKFWMWPRQAFNNGGPADLGGVLNTYIGKCIETLPEVFDDNVTALVLTTPQASARAPVIAKTFGMTGPLSNAMNGFYQNIAASR